MVQGCLLIRQTRSHAHATTFKCSASPTFNHRSGQPVTSHYSLPPPPNKMAKEDNGLEWVAGTFGLEPHWTTESNIAKVESLARKRPKLEQSDNCHVTFYAQGAFNKLYKIETEDGCELMRVSLPVDPRNKVNSEVATMDFVGRNTDIPVPRVFAFDDSGGGGRAGV